MHSSAYVPNRLHVCALLAPVPNLLARGGGGSTLVAHVGKAQEVRGREEESPTVIEYYGRAAEDLVVVLHDFHTTTTTTH